MKKREPNLQPGPEEEDPLARLRQRINEQVASMQTPAARAACEALLTATPKELGEAAVRGARESRKGLEAGQPGVLEEQKAKVNELLHELDPTWKGGKPEIRPPVELPPRADGRSWVESVVAKQQGKP